MSSAYSIANLDDLVFLLQLQFFVIKLKKLFIVKFILVNLFFLTKLTFCMITTC